MKNSVFCGILMVLLLTSGCALLGSHRTNLQQGNIIEQSVVSQLHRGMTEAQVSQVMGDAVYDNTFDPNRRVYVFEQLRHRVIDRVEHVIVTFANGRVRDIEVR